MAEVPVRPPRFLGEKVPYREQSTQERIQQNLPDYEVVSSNGGYIARAKSKEYTAEKDKSKNLVRKATYVPHEIVLDSQGQTVKEIKRGLYYEDTWSDGWSKSPFVKEETDYSKQTRYTYEARELKSGRETIRQTSSLVGGRLKEKPVIHQTSPEYDKAVAEHKLFSKFVGDGMGYAQARQLSRATEEQRTAYFKEVAKQKNIERTSQYRAQKLQAAAQAAHQKEYGAEAQKYASDIFTKQETERTKPPVVQTPKPVSRIQPTGIYDAPTPASPTTRTDMGSQLFMPSEKATGTMEATQPYTYTKGIITDSKQYERQLQLESDNVVQRQIDKLKFKYEDASKQIDFHPVLTDVAVPFAVGTTSMVLTTAAHPVQTFKGLLHPIETAKGIRQIASERTMAKGEVYSISALGGELMGAYIVGRAGGKVFEYGKDVYVKTGSKYIPPEKVFSEEVLSGKKTFPTTKSTAKSLAAFNKGAKSYDIKVAESIVRQPELYSKTPTAKPTKLSHPVIQDIQAALPKENIVYTGGVARRVLTGKGRIRDVDVVSKSPKADAYAVAKRFPDKYEIIQHEKYPEIYRLRDRKTRKVVADFDPSYLAEEGLFNAKSKVRVGEYNVVKPEILLKSKATQIVRGKVNSKYPWKQGENIQQLNPDIPVFKDQMVVSTASPAKLKGKTVTGKTEKVGLEDPGLYVTPKSQASPYFTGVGTQTAYSINPFKGLFGVPTVTEIAIKGVRTYPQKIVIKPGFAHLEKYQATQTGKGYAFITKRSQVGTGDIPRQKFILTESTKMGGQTIKPGPRWEAGTSEIEAVIGVGETFTYEPKTITGKIKGFDYYTKYQGRAIAVREAVLISKGDATPPSSTVLSSKKIKTGQESFDVVASQGRVMTPVSYSRASALGSFKPTYTKPLSSAVEGYYESSIPTPRISVPSGGVVSSVPLGSASQFVSGRSVATSVKYRPTSVRIPASSAASSASRVVSVSSIGGLSSGKSFGGSSGGGSSGGGSSGGSSITSTSTVTTPIKPPVPPLPPPILKATSPKRERREQYRVEVRRKGVFKTIAVTDTPQAAFRIGKQKVEQTAAASLRVSPVGHHEKVTGVGKGILPMTKFRQSTKEPDVFIQKRRFRISSPGEKRDITYKGIFAQRSKKRTGGVFG